VPRQANAVGPVRSGQCSIFVRESTSHDAPTRAETVELMRDHAHSPMLAGPPRDLDGAPCDEHCLASLWF